MSPGGQMARVSQRNGEIVTAFAFPAAPPAHASVISDLIAVR